MKRLTIFILLILISCDHDTSTLISTDKPLPPIPAPKDSIVIPSNEVSMACIDLVSSGGRLRAVIRSQPQYDSLIYVRFQKPLDEYWNANYPRTLELVKLSHPGLSGEACDSIARHIIYSVLPFRGTDTCTQPSIDFSRYTLLGQEAISGGCTRPDYQMSVCSFDSMRSIVFRLHIIQHGNCSVGFIRNKWLLIPRIPDSCEVSFESGYEIL